MVGPLVIGQRPQMRRKMRNPRHTFQLRTQPWQIQPFMIAPVLPGETLKNAVFQSRAVTDPINNKVVGWWNEYYFFYIKHRDLKDRDLLTAMVLNPEADLSSLDSATKVEHYHTNGTGLAINWVDLCLECVVENYFRNEGETYATANIGNLPAASAHAPGDSWLDSAINDTDLDSLSSEDLTSTVAGQGDATVAVTTAEVHAALQRYQLERLHRLTDMTYEQFLATYGVKMPSVELHIPELIRFVKDWQYPSNTIDPTNGAARSAVSWSTSDRIDKDRFFKEPGFIFGVTVKRPKVYLRNANTNAVMLMNTAYSWLPTVLSDDPFSSLVKMVAGDPPLDINTAAYWVDIKDIFMYGDQFVNYALSDVVSNIIDLPTAALLKRYADVDDANALFVGVTDPTRLIREDGVVQLHIATHMTDTSPESTGTNITV